MMMSKSECITGILLGVAKATLQEAQNISSTTDCYQLIVQVAKEEMRISGEVFKGKENLNKCSFEKYVWSMSIINEFCQTQSRSA